MRKTVRRTAAARRYCYGDGGRARLLRPPGAPLSVALVREKNRPKENVARRFAKKLPSVRTSRNPIRFTVVPAMSIIIIVIIIVRVKANRRSRRRRRLLSGKRRFSFFPYVNTRMYSISEPAPDVYCIPSDHSCIYLHRRRVFTTTALFVLCLSRPRARVLSRRRNPSDTMDGDRLFELRGDEKVEKKN